MRQYGQVLYWHIRRMVIDHDDAQDVMQETAIKILENIGKFKGNSQLSTWVYRIATNEALMNLRRKTNLFQSIDSLAPELAERLEAQTDLSGDHATVLFQQARREQGAKTDQSTEQRRQPRTQGGMRTRTRTGN